MSIVHDESATEAFLRRKAIERDLIDLHYPLLALEREEAQTKSPAERLSALEDQIETLLENEEQETTIMPTRTRHDETQLSEEDEARVKRAAKDLHLSPKEEEALRESLRPSRQTHSRDATAELNADGLSTDDLKTQRALGLSTTQIQKAKVRSLRAERARLDSR